MSDIVDRLNDSLSAGYSELRKEAAQEILQLRKARDELQTELKEVRHGVAVAHDVIKTLRTKIEAMEKQEPTMWVNSSNIISAKINKERRGAGDQHTCSETKTAYHDAPLYALSGAQPTSNIPDGWLRAIDEALVVAHIGVANESDTYEQAREKLDNLIGFHADIAADAASWLPVVADSWEAPDF